MKDDYNPFSIPQWLAWLGATMAAAISLITFQFATFASKETVKEYKDDVHQRLDRLEAKIDKIQDTVSKKK